MEILVANQCDVLDNCVTPSDRLLCYSVRGVLSEVPSLAVFRLSDPHHSIMSIQHQSVASSSHQHLSDLSCGSSSSLKPKKLDKLEARKIGLHSTTESLTHIQICSHAFRSYVAPRRIIILSLSSTVDSDFNAGVCMEKQTSDIQTLHLSNNPSLNGYTNIQKSFEQSKQTKTS